jgi:hypothetical protein
VSQQILAKVEASSLKSEVPAFAIGDTVDVHTRILEGEKERVQVFNGVVIPMEIYHDKKIPEDAKFSIGTAGLLGDAYIEIRSAGNASGKFIEPGAFVPDNKVSKGSGLSAMQNTLDGIGKKADVVLVDVSDAAKELKDALKRVNEGALSEKTLGNFRKSMEHLESTLCVLCK